MSLQTLRTAVTALAMGAAIGCFAFKTDTVTVASKYIPEPNKVAVITPDAAATDKALPTVYLLNGYGGDYRAWGNIRPDMGELADKYGVVIVMPSGMDAWYWDSPVRPEMQMESFFVNDLVPNINKNYPVADDAKLRAITGLSMGGHGGLWLGTRHPDIWNNMGSTSGGVYIVPFPKNWKMAKALGPYEENPERWEAMTVINLVPKMAEQKQNIIFDCGSEDFFADVNKQLHQKMLDAKVPHDYISRPGKHNAKYWGNSILYQLLYFNERFNEARNNK